MTTAAIHERHVAGQFDRLHARFKPEVAEDDVRLTAVLAALGPLRGLRVLDLGCGKGRFAARLREAGAEVVGLDVSVAMLAAATGLDRVQGSAARLPFAAGIFDAVVAVEVFEHLPGVDAAVAEARRVLGPSGVLAVVDKNACSLNASRPWLPNLAVKWLDERRGLWMYPAHGPVRERWFRPGSLRRLMACHFESVTVSHILSPAESARALFRVVPGVRLLTLWTARAPGGTS